MIVTNVIDKTIKYFLILLMAVLSFLGVYQVVMRAIGMVPAWTEELIRFLFVWASCVGAAIGIKEHIHIGIDVIVNIIPRLGQKICAVLVQLILICFDCFLIKVGFEMVQKTLTQPSPALRLPMGYVYLAVPVMGILGVYYSVFEIIRLIRERKEKADA